jgi:hypothetical protein
VYLAQDPWHVKSIDVPHVAISVMLAASGACVNHPRARYGYQPLHDVMVNGGHLDRSSVNVAFTLDNSCHPRNTDTHQRPRSVIGGSQRWAIFEVVQNFSECSPASCAQERPNLFSKPKDVLSTLNSQMPRGLVVGISGVILPNPTDLDDSGQTLDHVTISHLDTGKTATVDPCYERPFAFQ